MRRSLASSSAGEFTLAFLGYGDESDSTVIELTYNWDGDDGLPSDSRHFGHLAYAVENIYEMCQHLMDNGVTSHRPPRDGHMAFVRSPDNISVELLPTDANLDVAANGIEHDIAQRAGGDLRDLLSKTPFGEDDGIGRGELRNPLAQVRYRRFRCRLRHAGSGLALQA